MNLVENYTTKIPAARTVGEVQGLLAAHGANRIMVEYESGSPVGMTFELFGDLGFHRYTLPVRVAAMAMLLSAQKKAGRLPGISAALANDPAHAERVAWRVTKEWVAAQLTLVAAGMASVEEVMLPYMVTDSGRTLWLEFSSSERRSLEAGPVGQEGSR